jgi:LysM repeat protein
MHTVQAGETLSKIAAKYKLKLTDLAQLNPQIKDPAKIFVGQKILLPGDQPVPVDYFVYDSTSTILGIPDGAVVEGMLTKGSVAVTSVDDMVQKLRKDLAKRPGSKIKSLYILGHGRPGSQGLGSGRKGDATGKKSLKLSKDQKGLRGGAEKSLRLLATSFAPGAVVTLAGCRTGKDKVGQKLLLEVSKALGGVWVQAGQAYQLAMLVPGMEGTVVRCNQSSCYIVQDKPLWEVPGQVVELKAVDDD